MTRGAKLLVLAFVAAGLVLVVLMIVETARAANWRITSVAPADIADTATGKQLVLTVNHNTGLNATAVVDGNQISAGPMLWRDARHGDGPALLVLLHECGHITGIQDERQATQFALDHLKGVLSGWFALSSRQVARRYRQAVRFMYAMNPAYWATP